MKKMKKSKKSEKAEKTNKPDLGAIFDAHIRHEFVDHDVARFNTLVTVTLIEMPVKLT